MLYSPAFGQSLAGGGAFFASLQGAASGPTTSVTVVGAPEVSADAFTETPGVGQVTVSFFSDDPNPVQLQVQLTSAPQWTTYVEALSATYVATLAGPGSSAGVIQPRQALGTAPVTLLTNIVNSSGTLDVQYDLPVRKLDVPGTQTLSVTYTLTSF